MSVLELVVSLALLSLVGLGAWSGLESLQASARLEAARMDLLVALCEARRSAYATQETVFAAAAVGDTDVVVRRADGSERRVPLRDGLAIVGAPARGGVSFWQSGWAENGTFTVGWPSAGHRGTAAVIVNQRGRIR
jgi:hypothetical protein